MSRWTDNVVLVTGGSAGLGLAIGRAFAARGARVLLVGRDPQRLDLARSQLAALGLAAVETQACDVTRDDDVAGLERRVAEQFGRLDALVNNAGISSRGRILETPLETVRQMWELNFLAALRCSQVFAKHLLPSRGHLVNIGSLASKTASANLGGYPVTKFPLAALSQQLRLELGPSGLHVLLVCPGPIERTDAGQRYDALAANLPAEARQPGGGVKLKRIAPAWLAERIVRACERRQAELIVPSSARVLFALTQLFPNLGDWIVRRKTRG